MDEIWQRTEDTLSMIGARSQITAVQIVLRDVNVMIANYHETPFRLAVEGEKLTLTDGTRVAAEAVMVEDCIYEFFFKT